MKTSLFITSLVLTSSLFIGCSSDNTTSNTKTLYNALFVDSPVAGISWTCGTQNGVTDAQGKFGACEVGIPVSFTLGTLKLGTITDTSTFGDPKNTIITPKIIGEVTGDADVETKIAIILQSFDSDGDPSNGISITPETIAAVTKTYPNGQDLTSKTVTVTEMVAVTTAVVAEVVQTTGITTMRVVDETTAKANLAITYADIKEGKITPPAKIQTTGATGAN